MSPEGMLPTELFGHTCFRQLSQFVASIAFFNGSEYFLAASIHGTSTVDSSCKYQKFVFFCDFEIEVIKIHGNCVDLFLGNLERRMSVGKLPSLWRFWSK